jgi:hypothetical protein
MAMMKIVSVAAGFSPMDLATIDTMAMISADQVAYSEI